MAKIYFDTTPLIYFLDDEKPFSDKVANFIFDHQEDDDAYIISSITDAEYLVFPYRQNDTEKISSYESFLTDFNFRIVEPNRAITKQAAKIRSKYSGIKGMDAIHLATSLYFGCDMFLTNDTQLKQISEVNIVLVDDL
ncbi:MAG: PIN domain-containing protein [Spirochaetaceae bacterium]|nr:PIN domain-containing protein [Spirochaetaceae bacterium]